MTVLFMLDPIGKECFTELRLDPTGIAHEHVMAFQPREPCRTDTTFLRTKDRDPLQRSLSVTIDNTASMIPTIQKRDTILLSWIPSFW